MTGGSITLCIKEVMNLLQQLIGVLMLTLKKIRTVGIVNCIGIASIVCISGQCMATSIMPEIYSHSQQNPQIKRVIDTLSEEEISQIETIRNDFDQKLIASKEHLARVQTLFNQNLKVDTNETAIRQTFPPVAKAMEDIVVQQIMMMQKVNKVISAHKLAASDVGSDFTQVAIENSQELAADKNL